MAVGMFPFVRSIAENSKAEKLFERMVHLYHNSPCTLNRAEMMKKMLMLLYVRYSTL